MIPHIVPVSAPKTREEVFAIARRVLERRYQWQVRSAIDERRSIRLSLTDRRKKRTSKVEIILLRNMARARRVARKWHYTPPDADRIIRWCAERFRVTVADVKSPSRKRNAVQARHLAMKMIKHSKRGRGLSLKQVGRFFGDLDHTTVLNCLSKSPAARKFITKLEPWKFEAGDVAAVFRERLNLKAWENAAEVGKFCFAFYTRHFSTMKENPRSERAEQVASLLGMDGPSMIEAMSGITEKIRCRGRFVSP